MTDDATTPPPQPYPPQTAPPRRLMRSQDRVVGGVAGGVANYFGVDPVVVRIGWVLAAFAGGAGIVAYIAGWILMPEADDDDPSGGPIRRIESSTTAALLLLAAAVLIGIVDPFDNGVWFPVILVGAGVYLLLQDSETAPVASPATSSGAAVGSQQGWAPVPSAPASTTSFGTATTTSSGDTTELARYESPDGPLPPPPDHYPPKHNPRQPATLTRLTISALALTIAGGLLAHQLGADAIRTSHVIGACLAVVGIASITNAFVGRGRGLIPLGLVLLVAFGIANVAEPLIEDGIGERIYRPETIADVRSEYQLGAGSLEIDLRALDIAPGEVVIINAKLAMGELLVRAPANTNLELSGDVEVGELNLLGRFEEGVGNDLSFSTTEGGDGSGLLIIDLDLGIGEAKVTQ